MYYSAFHTVEEDITCNIYLYARERNTVVEPSKIKILVLDDDTFMLKLLSKMLLKQGFTSVSVHDNGRDALNQVDDVAARPDLILLDLNMPRIGGLELLKILREDDELKRSVVFVLTSSDVPEDIRKAYENSISGYIVKEHVGQDFINLIQLIEDFKLTVRFPPR